MVFVGVQPSLIQVPPTCSRSMMATFHPARANAVESGPPAWPEPITIASYCIVVISYSFTGGIYILIMSHLSRICYKVPAPPLVPTNFLKT